MNIHVRKASTLQCSKKKNQNVAGQGIVNTLEGIPYS